MRKACLNLNRYQKSIDPSDLGAVCFRKKSTFDIFALLYSCLYWIKQKYQTEQKYQKRNIYSDVFAAKNKVPLWIGGFTGVLNKFTDLINLLKLHR